MAVISVNLLSSFILIGIELIVGAALKIIYPEKHIRWDEKRIGEYDDNTYQIDLSIYSIGSSIMGEAKDHTVQGSKVSRPEIDKLAGSLIELNYNSGMFFSATDFSEDAYKKSAGSIKNPNAKKISLVHVRASKDTDREGRLEEVTFSIIVYNLDLSRAILNPQIEQNDYNKFEKLAILTPLKSRTCLSMNHYKAEGYGELIDGQSNKIGYFNFVKEFSEDERSQPKEMEAKEKGKWDNVKGEMEINGEVFSFSKINYVFYYIPDEMSFTVKQTGNPTLLIKCDDPLESVDKLVSDEELRKIRFKDDGEIVIEQ